MYPKVSFSDVPMSREEIESAKKLLLTRHLNFFVNFSRRAQSLR